jgi:GT2 family glycosyltransferase
MSLAADAGLGVAVLTYGDSGVHLSLLDSLWEEGLDPADVLVVHNPAVADEPDPERPAGCELIRTPRNLGYAGGMNVAIGALCERGAELLLLLTHDARLHPGSLTALLAAADPGFGVIGPALVLAGTGEPFSFGGITRWNGTCAHVRKRPAEVGAGVYSCDWVDGGTMLVRRQAVERAGGLDERFWGYCEESDFCLRVQRAGFKIGVALGAVADQEPGGAKRPGPWAYLLTRNGAEYARRAVGWRGAVTIEGRAAGYAVFCLLRVLVRCVRRRPGGAREPWAIAVGTARGGLDFLRRRWGPPPPNLPGMGDLSNV